MTVIAFLLVADCPSLENFKHFAWWYGTQFYQRCFTILTS